MNFEKPLPASESEQFDALLAEMERNPGGYIEYRSGSPKHKFLEYLLERGYLLHGSFVEEDVDTLEPRQANDRSKKSGNQKAVYAVSDPILPLFYAIKDRSRLRGLVQSGCSTDDQGVRTYRFQIDGTRSEKDPWKDGVVHVLSKDGFVQTIDDAGKLTNEWVSHVPVQSVARLRVAPDDFPFLEDVRVEMTGKAVQANIPGENI